MAKQACNAVTATAAITAQLEAAGVEIDPNSVIKKGSQALLAYDDESNKQGYYAQAQGKPEQAQAMLDHLDTFIPATEPKHTFIGGLTHGLRPNQIFPKEIHEPVLKAVEDFARANADDLHLKSREWVKTITPIIEGIDQGKVKPALQPELKDWLKDVKDGYMFGYNAPPGNVGTAALNNTVGNSLRTSPIIIWGNPAEIVLKIPTLLGPANFAKAVFEGNPWKKIPELERLGYYPSAKPLPANATAIRKGNRAVNNLLSLPGQFTNLPLTNIAYRAGELKYGAGQSGGLKGLESAAFLNRLGNDSKLGRNPTTKAGLKILNYTLSQYSMLGGIFKGIIKPDAPGRRAEASKQLFTYLAISSALGGGLGAAVPSGVSDLMEALVGKETYEQWFPSNAFGKTLRPGAIESVGIQYSMLSRAIQHNKKMLKDGAEKFNEGDYTGALLDWSDGAASMAVTTRIAGLSDPRALKILRNARKLAEQEIDQDEFWDEAKKAVLPKYFQEAE